MSEILETKAMACKLKKSWQKKGLLKSKAHRICINLRSITETPQNMTNSIWKNELVFFANTECLLIYVAKIIHL